MRPDRPENDLGNMDRGAAVICPSLRPEIGYAHGDCARRVARLRVYVRRIRDCPH